MQRRGTALSDSAFGTHGICLRAHDTLSLTRSGKDYEDMRSHSISCDVYLEPL